MIARTTVLWLGLSQLVCWGVTYYLIGCFADRIAVDLGWSAALVQGGFSVALLVMGLVSPLTGRLIDRHGGKPVMSAGSLLSAAGCTLLAFAHSVPTYYAAWVVLGVAMRFTLYDAAFAALARIGGPEAKRPIAQITLLGGLASTTFWPIGHALAERLGWRGATLVYAVCALATIVLHLAIPTGRHADAVRAAAPPRAPLAVTERDQVLASALYALIAMMANFLNSGMSAHMIGILAGLGLAGGTAVWIATLRGIGQSSARLAEVLFGARVHPLDLNLGAAIGLPICFVAGLWSGQWLLAAIVFTSLYGAANGLTTITRGTLPLVLFDAGTYGAVVGRLLAPSFMVSALAPLLYAWVIDRYGDAGALLLSQIAAGIAALAALALRLRFRPIRM